MSAVASPAYAGAEPYIFISYAHKNSDLVLPVVEELIRRGCRVWYDEGIRPGEAWDNSIADRLRGCRCFLAFPSNAYFASTNCRDELSMARAERKSMTMVYLEEVALTPGMQLRYNRLQALPAYSLPREELFRKLELLEGIQDTKEATAGG